MTKLIVKLKAQTKQYLSYLELQIQRLQTPKPWPNL